LWGGARAVGLEDQLGSVQVGKKADFIIVDLQKTNSAPVHDPISSLVYCATQENVQTVIIGGRIIMRDRVVLTVDEKSVLERANRSIESLMNRASYTPRANDGKPPNTTLVT
jgi:5-methylthioadenosine/S-adenosylhomocysteine deaminase